MKTMSAILASLVFLVGTVASTTALADPHHHHGGNVRFGFYLGPGFFYPPPRYYYPPVVVAPAPPPTYYIERDSVQPEPSAPQGYWYYCNEAKAYYPYVKECPSAWQQVVPRPPGG